MNRSCPYSRTRGSGTWQYKRNEDSKREGWASEMTQFIRHLPPTHVVERFGSYRLSSDLCASMHAYIFIHTQIIKLF